MYVLCKNLFWSRFLSIYVLSKDCLEKAFGYLNAQDETSIGYLGLRSSSLWQYADKWSLKSKHKLWTQGSLHALYNNQHVGLKKQRHSRRFGANLAAHQISLVNLLSGRGSITAPFLHFSSSQNMNSRFKILFPIPKSSPFLSSSSSTPGWGGEEMISDRWC